MAKITGITEKFSTRLKGSMPTLQEIQKYGPVDQRKVADNLGITLPAAYNHFQKLKDEGLLRQMKKRLNKQRGRPSELWDIDKKSNFTMGITIVPPYLLMGLADFSDRLFLKEKHDISLLKNDSELYKLIDDFVLKSLDAKSPAGEIRLVSVGLPGYLDPASGIVEASVNMPQIRGIDFEKHFETYGFHCRAHTHYYSYYYGEVTDFPKNTSISVIDWELGVGHVAGCGHETFNIGTTNDGMLRGIQDIAHMRVVPNGNDCICGRKGCLEAYVGGWAIIKKLNDKKISRLSDLIEAAKNDNQKVLDELSAASRVLGIQMSWIVQFLGIDRIVFTGPMSEVFGKVRASFCEGLAVHLTNEEIESVNPIASPDPLERIIKGSCNLARYMFFHPDYYLRNLGVSPAARAHYELSY